MAFEGKPLIDISDSLIGNVIDLTEMVGTRRRFGFMFSCKSNSTTELLFGVSGGEKINFEWSPRGIAPGATKITGQVIVTKCHGSYSNYSEPTLDVTVTNASRNLIFGTHED